MLIKKFVIGLIISVVFVFSNVLLIQAQAFKIPFKQIQLDNGLRVVMSEDHAAPVIAVVVYYDVGSRNEVKGRSGFAHLFEHMMFQGSKNVGKAQHFQYVENNGGFLNASTHADYTDFYNFLPANQLELALWLEADRMRSLKVTAVNLKNQKDAVKEEKRLSVDNQAYSPALTKMDEAIFRNWTNAHPSIGSMADLDAATLKDVKDFFRTYYAPNNAVLVIAGDIDTTKTESLVRKYFATIPRQPTPPPVDVTEPFETALPKTVAEDTHAEVPALAIAWKLPPRRSPDSYAIEMVKAVLFDGDSARVYQELVKKKKLALEINALMDERRGPSALTLLTLHKLEVKPDEVQAVVEAEIERIKNEGVGEAELNKVKNQYRLAQYLSGSEGEYTSLQTALGRALSLAEYALFDNDPSLINTELDRYLAVTPVQVKEAARKYFGVANRSVLHIKPATKNANGK